MRAQFVIRARILSAFLILIAVLLSSRLYFLQIVHGAQYRDEATSQYVVETGNQILDRGEILFKKRDGSTVAAAVMQSGWKIAISPKDITDPRALYVALSSVTPLDEERFFASAAKKDDPYEEVAFRLSDDVAANIRALKLPGVLLVRDQWRYYPGGELAANALGFVGFQGDKRAGVYGLERYWEETLARASSGLYVNPFAEIFTNLEAALSIDPATHEGNIISTIEPLAETHLEEVLDDVVDAYSPKLTGGIVMDPKTGAIVAMGVRPSFDPNTYNTVSNPVVFANPLVEGTYEMGSIMKPLTMAAGLDSGAITLSTTYNDKGCIEKSGYTVCNYDHEARGKNTPMQEILSQSLNLGVSFVVDQMGHDVFSKYMHAYALDEMTDVELPNEGIGNLDSIESGYDIDYTTAAFGQGVRVSPIEMTRALAVLANNGVLPSPHIVSAVRFESGITRSVEPKEGKQILKPETAETVTNMLVKVYDDALLRGELKMDHYSIAAKTGTAQIANPNGGGYYKDRYLHSFFGYFPAHDPQFIVFLFAVEPHGVEYASASLARPFYDMAKYLINYYNIPPDR